MQTTIFQRAHTLLELLVTLAFIGVLLSLAVPALAHILRQQRANTAINSIAGAFQTARNSAISLKVPVVFCAKQDDALCGRDWHNGALVFVDRNRNSVVDSGERVLTQLAAFPAGSTLRISTFGNRQNLRFSAQGFLENYSAGNIVFCAVEGDARYARNVIFARMGRFRFGDDANHDGFNEDANGRALTCP